MTTTISPATAAAPEPALPEAGTPTPSKRRRFKRPPIGYAFAVVFLVTLTLMAFLADYLPFIPYPDAKIPGPDGRPEGSHGAQVRPRPGAKPDLCC